MTEYRYYGLRCVQALQKLSRQLQFPLFGLVSNSVVPVVTIILALNINISQIPLTGMLTSIYSIIALFA